MDLSTSIDAGNGEWKIPAGTRSDRLKVLWFTNTLMPDAASHLGQGSAWSGWWMASLLRHLKDRNDVRIAVVTINGFRDAHFEIDGVEYFLVKRSIRRALQARLGSRLSAKPVRAQIEKCASIVKAWNPDVVHIHGAEADYGLVKAWRLVEKPVVLSIQGLMAPSAKKVYGELIPRQFESALGRVAAAGTSALHRWKVLEARIPVEESILASADLVLGRTDWDHAWAWAANPSVRYRHVEEALRAEFFTASPWNPRECRRHRIFCTSAAQPLKGLHILIEAIQKLRKVYPDVSLKVASGGFRSERPTDYDRYVFRLIRSAGLQESVSFLGWQDAKGLVSQLREAHCFVSPSFIENSSNAIQEAMLLGAPCVAAACGGTPSIIQSGSNGLTFPPGDVALLARRIHEVFQSDELAAGISQEARATGRARNAPERINEQIMAAYREAVAGR